MGKQWERKHMIQGIIAAVAIVLGVILIAIGKSFHHEWATLSGFFCIIITLAMCVIGTE